MRDARDNDPMVDKAVKAIRDVPASLEHQVDAIDTLATSIDPLRAAVDRLTDTMQELVERLAPLAEAEHETHRVERFFGRHTHGDKPAQEGEPNRRSDSVSTSERRQR